MKKLATILVLLLASASSTPVLACAACMGRSDSNMARGMNFGIFALLLVVVSVLAGIASVGVCLVKRASAVEAASTQNFESEFAETVEKTRP